MDDDFSDPRLQETDNTPHSIEAEQALLGILMIDNRQYYPDIRDILKPDDFYVGVHQQIAKVIWNRSRLNQPCDAILLKNRFSQDETLKDIGGVEYLAELLESAPDGGAVPEYGRMIADLSHRRLLLKLYRAGLRVVRDPDTDLDAEGMYDQHRNELDAMRALFAANADFIDLREAARERVEMIGVQRPMGMSTGYPDLDTVIAGLAPGKLYVLAGRPAMFKSGFASNIARNIADNAHPDRDDPKGKVIFFSQEMDAGELGERSASAEIGKLGSTIHYQDIAKHAVSMDEKARLLAAVERMPTFLVDEASPQTIGNVEKRARAAEVAMGGIDMIVVDFIQMMSGAGCVDPRNKASYVGEIAYRLKDLGKQLGCAVLCLAQLSRKCEERENKRPRLSDLKESSGIEEAANVVMGLYREDYYMEQAGPPAEHSKLQAYEDRLSMKRGLIEAIVIKNRGGPLKVVEFRTDLGSDLLMPLAPPEEYDTSLDFDKIEE